MKYVIRIKAVSECMRIRRAALCYLRLENHTYDIHMGIHPLKKFKSIQIIDSSIIVDGYREELKIGEEVYFYKTNIVDNGMEAISEELVLGAMIIPIDRSMEDNYLNIIEKNESIDEWKGEAFYLLGMIYEYDYKDDERASLWYLKAKESGFNFGLFNMDNIS